MAQTLPGLIVQVGAPQKLYQPFTRLQLRCSDCETGHEGAHLGAGHRDFASTSRKVKRAQKAKLHATAGFVSRSHRSISFGAPQLNPV